MMADRDFTKYPNGVLFDLTLSQGARLAYPALLHLAWRAGRREENNGVEMPTMYQLAATLGCSRTTLVSWVRELREAGLVVQVPRKYRQTVWFLFDARTDDVPGRLNAAKAFDAAPARGSESDPHGSQNLAPTRARNNGEVLRQKQDAGAKNAPDSHPPTLQRLDGRDVALDQLAEECGLDPMSSRIRDAAVAMNGSTRQTGIREQFWLELVRWAQENDRVEELEAAVGERFELALVEAIKRKAETYRSVWPHMSLTPHALAKYWLDLERATVRERGMTPDEIASFRG